MCTLTTAQGDCSADEFQALAVQSGAFGCTILANWEPDAPADQGWSTYPNGALLSLTNGDFCPSGVTRSIAATFVCATTLGPDSFTVSEDETSCGYSWTFPTSAACAPTPTSPPAPAPTPPTPEGCCGGGAASDCNFDGKFGPHNSGFCPGPHGHQGDACDCTTCDDPLFCTAPPTPRPAPLGPGGLSPDAKLAARNFGCGHISCGWMFIIIGVLALPIVGALLVPAHKMLARNGGRYESWGDAFTACTRDLSTVYPRALAGNVAWGIRWVFCNWRGGFRRWSCFGENAGAENQRSRSESGRPSPQTLRFGYQSERAAGAMYQDDDL